VGSPKQIDWAKRIRMEFLAAWQAEASHIRAQSAAEAEACGRWRSTGSRAIEAQRMQCLVRSVPGALEEIMPRVADAAWWIKHRRSSLWEIGLALAVPFRQGYPRAVAPSDVSVS
jgi:hypothetical protein